ncbi:DUF2934 domain-containing protein [Bradyrhizobium sp. ARR65]|uniref:DUF2934 domain-containing protein n=1 Tax=Bradyrhizobium sp. ARR65 TaxID=1040989 RepID=UPI0004673E81|nr:DUF2934 domain-containing protein [Bradyrhizobium sp. ARR65]
MSNLEQSIRERAYQLWIESGCTDGNAEVHWLSAQREILQASLGNLGSEAAPAKPKKAKAPRTKKRAA